jgi:NAD(P)-dependent dehydrogenase (short-subunit alcohol dehydrogenase family)
MPPTIDPTRPLEHKVAIVLGASRGIGAAIARAFSKAGASVALAARDRDALENLAAQLDQTSGPAIAVPTDVTDPDDISDLVARTVEAFGGLDLACNNAANTAGPPPTRLADVGISDFDASLSVNLRGVFLALKHEIPAMLASGGGGAIVNMSSAAGVQAVAGLASYVSTKFGVEGLTRVAALDYADARIRVNAIAPGPILTDNLRRAGTAAQQAAADAMPMRRIGQPEEIADAAVWLCSGAAAYVTGTTLVIDGGKLAGTAPFTRPPDPPRDRSLDRAADALPDDQEPTERRVTHEDDR